MIKNAKKKIIIAFFILNQVLHELDKLFPGFNVKSQNNVINSRTSSVIASRKAH